MKIKKIGVVLLLIIVISSMGMSSVYADADRGHIYYDQIKFHFYSYSSGAQSLDYYVRLSEVDSDGRMQHLATAVYESRGRGDVFDCFDSIKDILNDPNNIGKTYYIDAYAEYEWLAESPWSSSYTEVVLGEDREVNIASDTYLGDFPDITTYATIKTYLNPKQTPKLIIDSVNSTGSARVPIKAVDESGNPIPNLKISAHVDNLKKETVAPETTLITDDHGYVYFDFKPTTKGTYCIIAMSSRNGDYIKSNCYWKFVYIN
jgi:hypothetical protein